MISQVNDSFYLVCMSQTNNSEVHQINKDHSYQKSETQWTKVNRTKLGQVSLHAVIQRHGIEVENPTFALGVRFSVEH